MSDQELERHLKSMEELAFFTGSVLVEKKGDLLLSKGYGKHITAQTVFQIASITKQFTAAAILLLEESGALDLDAPINSYLGEWESDHWKDITVHHLLSHTSGIPNYTDWEDYRKIAKSATVEKILKRARKESLNFRPGTQFEYCNTAYLLLGVIIEENSRQSYAAFVKEQLLIPAGMRHSGVYSKEDKPPKDAAVGYCLNDSGEKLIEDRSESKEACGADGALFSTVDDLNKWSKVLDGKTSVLTPSIIKKMTTPHMEGFGYGLCIGKSYGHRAIFHSGQMAGFNADFCKYPDEDITIVVLGNNLHYNAQHVTGVVTKRLFTREEIPVAIPFPDDFDFSFFDREFRSENGDYIEFYVTRKGRLFIDEQLPVECLLLSNGRLFSGVYGTEYELKRNGEIVVYDSFDTIVDTLS